MNVFVQSSSPYSHFQNQSWGELPGLRLVAIVGLGWLGFALSNTVEHQIQIQKHFPWIRISVVCYRLFKTLAISNYFSFLLKVRNMYYDDHGCYFHWARLDYKRKSPRKSYCVFLKEMSLVVLMSKSSSK